MNGETSSIPTGPFFPLLGNEEGNGLCHHQHHPRPFQPNTIGDGDRIDVRDAIDGDLQPGGFPRYCIRQWHFLLKIEIHPLLKGFKVGICSSDLVKRH
ncbi:hypothetical protein MRB53_022866 [Persea americana]|uniref:Uncharacterized protein n=1 Tax=Persea americana TaxID=3435 RepID=A0ACC2L8C0_PERAE|nr:hypothetical protein MRB53_022866 [Persea americana]